MAFDYGDKLAPEVQDPLDQYVKTASADYGANMAPVRQAASRELDAEIMGGDQQGQVAGYQQMAQRQGFEDEQNRFDTGLSLKRAQLGEELRQRGQQRGWDVADRDVRLARLRGIATEASDRKNKQQQAAMGNQIGSGIGSIVGGIYGGPAGAAAGGAVLGQVGGGIGAAI